MIRSIPPLLFTSRSPSSWAVGQQAVRAIPMLRRLAVVSLHGHHGPDGNPRKPSVAVASCGRGCPPGSMSICSRVPHPRSASRAKTEDAPDRSPDEVVHSLGSWPGACEYVDWDYYRHGDAAARRVSFERETGPPAGSAWRTERGMGVNDNEGIR